MNKILTVSVAAYNVEKYIEKALESFVVPEVLDKIEVLIINDGSTDNTEGISLKYQKKYPNSFRLINKKNGGWGSTVNKGIELANGKYFKQLDGDDYFDSTSLVDFIRFLEKHDEDLIYTNFMTFDDETNKVIKTTDVKLELKDKKVNINDVNVDFPLAMHACTFKTDILRKDSLDITEHCFYTDIEYLLKAIVKVKEIYFFPINVYCYRLGRIGQSASVQGYRRHYKEHVFILLKLLNLYVELKTDDNIRKIIYDRLNIMVDYQYYIFLNLERKWGNACELKSFDKKLKRDFSQFYKTTRKRIKLFRLFGRFSYFFIVYKND